eukprot:TRINITY_DN828_c0_g1_i1.p2 TRINITY_DN828_c0_g1~~TRINITY_DN828_c0_g1_i1.p2  ORF type:complete len:277 (+),score=131.39 TRINITY_DN828_c0_g1_i1:95-925(+)
MARGPRKHMKRLNAPRHWMLDKNLGVFAPKARPGAHKGRECLPLILILRNRLKYALTATEASMITRQRFVEVDGRVRTDPKYPVGFMDVLTIPKTDDKFRVMYDVKGRFVLHKLTTDDEAQTKICKVIKTYVATNGVPCLCTHDGRTLRYPDPLIKAGDTVVLDLGKDKDGGKIIDFIKFKPGVQCMVTGGANTGRVGEIIDVERHPGSFDIVHVRDANDNTFATRKGNIFVIGRSQTDIRVALPKGKGIRVPLAQDREGKIANYAKGKQGKKSKK